MANDEVGDTVERAYALACSGEFATVRELIVRLGVVSPKYRRRASPRRRPGFRAAAIALRRNYEGRRGGRASQLSAQQLNKT